MVSTTPPTSSLNQHLGLEDLLRSILQYVTLTRLPAFNWPSIAETLNSSDPAIRALGHSELSKLSGSLESALLEDPRFPGSRSLMLSLDNGAIGLYPNGFASKLLLRVVATGSVDSAIEWARKVLSTASATGWQVAPLWGIEMEQELDLGEGMHLVPISSLRPGPNLRWLREQLRLGHNTLLPSMLTFQTVGAALTLRRKIDNAVHAYEEFAEPSGMTAEEFARIETLFYDAVLALSAIGPQLVLPVARWFEYEDPDLEAAVGGETRSTKFLEMLPLRLPSPVQIDQSEASELVQKYRSLPGESKAKVRIALERLRQSLMRHSTGDAAVELSIALEALFGDDEKNEMTYRIATRFARFLGGFPNERRRFYELAKRVYEVRSSMVHGGKTVKTHVKVGDERLPVDALLAEVASEVALAARRIILAGGVPCWREFDLQ